MHDFKFFGDRLEIPLVPQTKSAKIFSLHKNLNFKAQKLPDVEWCERPELVVSFIVILQLYKMKKKNSRN